MSKGADKFDNRSEPTALLTGTEQILIDAVSDVLGFRIGVDEPLLSSGIDSIAAICFLTRVTSIFRTEIPFEALFSETSTIAELAQQVDRMRLDDRSFERASETEPNKDELNSSNARVEHP